MIKNCYYPEAETHIKDKVKVLLNLSNYATKKKLEHAVGVGTSNFAANKDFIALKVKIEKQDINKLVNAPTGFNDLQAKR